MSKEDDDKNPFVVSGDIACKKSKIYARTHIPLHLMRASNGISKVESHKSSSIVDYIPLSQILPYSPLLVSLSLARIPQAAAQAPPKTAAKHQKTAELAFPIVKLY